jgi:RibD C-terminal domain
MRRRHLAHSSNPINARSSTRSPTTRHPRWARFFTDSAFTRSWSTTGRQQIGIRRPSLRARIRPHLEGQAQVRLLEKPRQGRVEKQPDPGQHCRRGAKLKGQPGGDLEVGGANLASTFMELGLIDEYRPMIQPVVLGAGTPFFPPSLTPVNLRLVETRRFESGVVHLRYEVAAQDLAASPGARAR